MESDLTTFLEYYICSSKGLQSFMEKRKHSSGIAGRKKTVRCFVNPILCFSDKRDVK